MARHTASSRTRATKGASTLAFLGLFAAGCDLPGRPDPADRPMRADQVESFPALYAQNCAGCHGAEGKLGPAPPLHDPLFLAIVPDAELFRVIHEGRPGTPMPAFARDQGGPLTPAQIEVLAQGIKARWGGEGATSREGARPEYALAGGGDAQRGAAIFSQACAVCHGAPEEGVEDGIQSPSFLALISDQAIRRYIITGRPDLGMPDYATRVDRPAGFQPLTSEAITDLVALLASWRSDTGPPGK